MDLKDIAKNYERMPDVEIVRIVTTDARGLRPEVFAIIEKEIKKRNLNPDILKGALAQNKEYSLEEIREYSRLLRNLPCPSCGNTSFRLNGTLTYTVTSFILFTSHRSDSFIGCPDCLNKKNNNAILSTALFGWWGVPWGLIKTPLYIYRNIMAKKYIGMEHPNDTLLNFTLANIGEIETYKENREKLQKIIMPRSY